MGDGEAKGNENGKQGIESNWWLCFQYNIFLDQHLCWPWNIPIYQSDWGTSLQFMSSKA